MLTYGYTLNSRGIRRRAAYVRQQNSIGHRITVFSTVVCIPTKAAQEATCCASSREKGEYPVLHSSVLTPEYKTPVVYTSNTLTYAAFY